MDRTPLVTGTRMGRRQAFGDIHEGAGLSQEDIEHLRQVNSINQPTSMA